nr:hypothetical protein [Paracoccus sp. S-4012]
MLRFLDTRSFPSLWYWLALCAVWAITTRSVLGVPVEVVIRARQTAGEAERPEGLLLLDWLSLTLPRWRIGRGEGAVLVGVTAFVLVALGVLGFGYGLETAQALVLLFTPLGLLLLMRLRLAHRLAAVMGAAESGGLPAAEAAAQAARLMTRHRRIVAALSIMAVAIAAAWGTLWNLMHPYGV